MTAGDRILIIKRDGGRAINRHATVLGYDGPQLAVRFDGADGRWLLNPTAPNLTIIPTGRTRP